MNPVFGDLYGRLDISFRLWPEAISVSRSFSYGFCYLLVRRSHLVVDLSIGADRDSQ
jgi:hypothetical protein